MNPIYSAFVFTEHTKNVFLPPHLLNILLLGFVLLLSACSNDGGSDSTVDNTPPESLSIVVQPYNQTVVADTTAIFAVVATGATTYQWIMSNDGWASVEEIAGATSPVLILDPVTTDMNGVQYRIAMTGADGSTLVSAAATLTVVTLPQLPKIVVQPAPAEVTAPNAATFSVTATGTNLSYQWQGCSCTPVYDALDGWDNNSWENIPGATLATLSIDPTDSTMDGVHIRVIVSNALGGVSSDAVPLLVASPPSPPPVVIPMPPQIINHPQVTTVVENTAAIFTVEFIGYYSDIPEPVVRWEYSTDAGQSWINANNAGSSFGIVNDITQNTLIIASASLAANGTQYRAVITNELGESTSEPAILYVVPPGPRFIIEPSSITVNAGDNAHFTVDVTSTSVPTFQWQISSDSGANWGDIVGATSTSYTVINTTVSMSGYLYRCVATDNEGSKTSGAAQLGVNSAPVAVDDTVDTGGSYAVDIPMSMLLANDMDPNQDNLLVSAVGNCSHCSVQMDVYSSNIAVVVDLGYVGTVTFEYTITDGMMTSTGLVSIVVGDPLAAVKAACSYEITNFCIVPDSELVNCLSQYYFGGMASPECGAALGY